MKKILTLAILALAFTALYAPAALAQDDDDGFDDGYDDDDYGYVAPAAPAQYYDDADGDGYYDDDDGGGYVAPAASTQSYGDDDDGTAASAAPLPSTGGPMLLPVAGLLFAGAGISGLLYLRRKL